MTTLAFSPQVLEWASQNIGRSLDSLSHELTRKPKTRDEILKGNLTVSQAEKLASKTHVPFGYLFLKKPPQSIRPSIPDLRQTQNADPLSVDFYEVLDDALQKQEWYRDYLLDLGTEPLAFVGRFPLAKMPTVEEVAQDIRRTLQLGPEARKYCADADAYFSRLSQLAEDAGILVIKTSYVKSATRRGLSFKEFRGFALTDSIAPLVFVNGSDWEVAWAFTLIHEISHIWLGATGVSDLRGTELANPTEAFCNAVAAEVLVPAGEFERIWDGSLDYAAKHFKVSRIVIARRALSLGKISKDEYTTIANASRQAKQKKTGEPSYYNTFPIRNSKKFTSAVVNCAMGEMILLRDAGSLLNASPNTIVEYAKRQK